MLTARKLPTDFSAVIKAKFIDTMNNNSAEGVEIDPLDHLPSGLGS